MGELNWRRWGSVGVTLLALPVVHVATHGLRLPYAYPETMLVGMLLGAGFAAGLRAEAASRRS